nr:hypothetical protein [Tanacetum cinerariifolium]
MLDRTDFASWQQRIRLYYQGKDNGVNILKSINEGPYKLRTFRETLAESTEGTSQFGPERPRVYSDLNSEERDRYNADIWATNILLQGFPKDIYTLINHYTDAKDIWDNEESINDYYVGFSKLINDIRNIKMRMPKLQLNSKFLNNKLPEWGRFVTAVKLNRGLRESNYDQLFAYLKQHEAHAKENKMVLEHLSQPIAQPTAYPLALLSNVSNTEHGSPSLLTSSITPLPPPRYGEAQNRVGNVNQGQARPGQARTVKCYNCNGTGHIAWNCTQPKRPQNSEYFKDKMLLMQAQENGVALDTEQLLFLAGGPDNAFDVDVDEQPIQDLALNVDNEEHVMHDSVQLDHVIDLHADYTSVGNMIPYDQYVKDNEVPVVHSNASTVQNDTFMMIYNDMCKPSAPSVSNSSKNAVVKNSLTAKLATYREQVKLYERRAKFELTEREQKINEQLRMVISYHNFKEETLKRELHSIKLQLASTINRNKSMVEETTFLKQDFKQKENKLLADFLNMKSLKEKVEDKLVKQDQSLQTVYMLCRPRPLYNDQNKVAIGYKNPLCLTRAKQAQPALYNGHEILKDNHAQAKVHNTEDTLEITEITRKKMNAKMTDPECVTHKVKIAPHDYSKENLLATFTPQKQLTPEQIYWSNDLMKLKSKALKKRAKVSRPIKAFTVYPSNTPTTLVPRVLSTTSQVKIHNFTLIQLFLEFDKTCKKRITPSAITDEERGFEQTKACYLQEDSIGNNPPTPEKDTPDFDSIFVTSKMQAFLQGKDNVIRQLKKQLSELQMTSSDTKCTVKVRTTDSQLTKVTDPVTNLQAQNDRFRVENDKVKQHYKQLYDSVKITHAKHIEQVTKLTAKNVTLKTSVSKAKECTSRLSWHLKESVETIRDIVEEAKVVRPLDRSIVSACRYTQHSQELLEYAIDTCPQGSQQRAKQLAHTPLIRKKQVIATKPSDRQDNNKNKHVVTKKIQKTNVHVPHFTGVKRCPKASGSQPKSNHKTNRISPTKGANKLPVEDMPMTNKSHLRTTNRVDSSSRLKRTVINSNSNFICQTCNKCLTSFDHDMCVAIYVKSVVLPHSTRHNCEVERKIKQVWKPKQVGKVWKPTGKVLTTIGHQWRPTGQILRLGTQCPLTRFTPPRVVSAA